MSEAAEDRLLAALNTQEPKVAAAELARALKAEGMSQVQIFRLFSRYQQQLSGSDPRYDVVVETMDLIWSGPWAKGRGLFPEALSDERLRSE